VLEKNLWRGRRQAEEGIAEKLGSGGASGGNRERPPGSGGCELGSPSLRIGRKGGGTSKGMLPEEGIKKKNIGEKIFGKPA